MSTIYVAIPCFRRDTELVNTIKCIFDNASDENEIHIGIAFTGDKIFFEKTMESVKEYKNIKAEYYDQENNFGTGKGRVLASKMYDDEDYFFQIDAHTFLLQDWDKTLIKKFKKAKRSCGSDKIVISGIPGRYGYYNEKGEEEFWYYAKCHYPFYRKNQYHINDALYSVSKKINGKIYRGFIPKYIDYDLYSILVKVHTNIFKKIYGIYRYFSVICGKTLPNLKVSGAFIFSNKEFVKTGLAKSTSVFWEEEYIQSIELIHNGFAIVYPGNKIPVCHMYSNLVVNGAGKRDHVTDHLDGELAYKMMYENWMEYYFSNLEKIEKYEKYAKISVLDGPIIEYYVPRKHNS